MDRFRRLRVLIGVVVALSLTATLSAQPFAAQIQAALRAFLQTVNHWTAQQNFDGGATCTGTCSGFSSGNAPASATYLLQTANATLTNAQALGALSSGILRGATTTGVVTSLGDMLPSANGGTANAFFTVSGPTTSAKTFTFPNADSTILYSGGALGTPSSGTLSSATGLPVSTGISGLGTGVATALAVNVGSAGAFVTFNGALGTPSSGTLTSATGLPVSTGISGLGTGVATALAVNVGSAGAFVTFNGAGGTPSSLTLTNATGLPVAGGGTGVATITGVLRGNGASAFTGLATNTVTSSATPTINTDTTDEFTITALAVAITSMTTNLSGSPVNGQRLTIRILDNGTARAITWGASFVARGVALPTTTTLSKYLYVQFIWNSTASVWDCVASATEA